MGATKNTGLALQKQNFQFYYTVVKYRLFEKYGKKGRKIGVNGGVNLNGVWIILDDQN